jgi:hypothetical protein
VLISSCAAPRYRYITDSGDKTYFKVPYGWRQVSSTDLCGVLKQIFAQKACPPIFNVAYQEGSSKPTASNLVADNLTKPFLFAEVSPPPVDQTTGAPETLDLEKLEDAYLPVTPMDRAAAQIPLTHFVLLRQDTVTSTGFQGVRETYSYTYPDGKANTFNVDAFTNTGGTLIYLLVVHCLASCYQQDRTAIDAVMNSFTMRRNLCVRRRPALIL